VTALASEEDRGGRYHDRFAPSEAVTDDEGWFVLDWVAPGLRELNAHDYLRPALGRARAGVMCVAGETATCELRLDLGLTIAGTVIDEDGAPLAGWSVASEAPLTQPWTSRQARTDAQGRFRLFNLGDSAHDLIVRSTEVDEHPRARLDGVPAGSRDVVIVVADAHVAKGALLVRFVAPPDTRPDDFILTLWKEGANEGHCLEPDVGGVFEVQVMPGRYHVQVQGGGKDLLTSAAFAVEPGGSTDMGELVIEQAGRVEITLAGLPRQMLERLKLSLEREGCSTVSPEEKDGVFLSPELMPGRWTVSMNTSDLYLRPPEVEVVSSTTTRVELRVEPTVRVPVVFTNPANDEVTVGAFDATGRHMYSRRYLRQNDGEAAGERRLSIGLPPGHATICLRTHAGLGGAIEVDVKPELAGAPPIRIELR
jgi:hypothetical protein